MTTNTPALTAPVLRQDQSVMESVIVGRLAAVKMKMGVGNSAVKVSYLSVTVMILSFQTDWSGQIVQTQIRLLLEEQSDQGRHCLLFHLHLFDEIPLGLAALFEFLINTAMVFGVQKFRNFKVLENCCYHPERVSTKIIIWKTYSYKRCNGIANSENSDQFDMSLHCLPTHICPKT